MSYPGSPDLVIPSGGSFRIKNVGKLLSPLSGVMELRGDDGQGARLRVRDGTFNVPSYSFIGGEDTGMYHNQSLSQLELVIDGTRILALSDAPAVNFLNSRHAEYRRTVINDGSGGEIATQSTGGVLTNAGATGPATFVLPLAPAPGQQYTIKRTVDFEVRVQPSGASAIVWSIGKMLDGDYVVLDSFGASITLISDVFSDWMSVAELGTLASGTP